MQTSELETPAADTAKRFAVLVVDDDPAFCETVADALHDRDLAAVAVTNPYEALRLAQHAPFSAAVIDLIMPEMDGFELAERVRSLQPELEFVMLTGHGDMTSAVEGLRQGFFDFLQKGSLQSIRLRRAVRAAISRGELRRENRRLLSGLSDSNRKLKTLNELSRRLLEVGHLDRLLAELADSAKMLLGAEAAAALLFERNGLGDVTLRTAVGDGEPVVGARFGPHDGIATVVAEHGRAVRVEEPENHPNYSRRCDALPTQRPGLACVSLSRGPLSGALMVGGRDEPFTQEDLALLQGLAQQGSLAIDTLTAIENHRNFFTHASEMLVSLLDSQDVHHKGHSRAVAALTDLVSRRLGLPEPERRTLHFAALLHDIGKLRLGPEVLGAGPFDATLRSAMRDHPTLGLQLLRPIAEWEALLPIIHTHHERWDGKGYPNGMSGEQIPLGARVIAVCEAFEVMTRESPGSPRRSVAAALEELERCAGTQFDPTIVRLFLTEYRDKGNQVLPRE